jgi:hypothetical protein
MEQQLVSHYARKFGACDREELGDLVARRADLSDEAAAGLDEALRSLGLREADVYAPPPPTAPRSEQEVAEQLASETRCSRELWRGGLATASKLLMGLIFMAPVQALLKQTQVGALWAGLSLLIVGYVGYWVGRGVTKSLCADGESDVGTKKKRLWLLLGALVVAYFVVYAISSAVFGRVR